MLKFKKLHKDAVVPQFMTRGAACFDFVATRIEQPSPDTAIIYFGLACEFPQQYVMTIQPRSSFSHKGWVMANSPGQIDSDYRGELQMRIQAIPRDLDNIFGSAMMYPILPFKVGDRVAQGKLEQVIQMEITEVKELSATEREGGFGSTGK